MPELIWEGKYDAQGQLAGPPRVALPFQTIETVNQSAQERQTALESFQAGQTPEWRNRLIWGDKKYVLPSLLAEFAGQVDLIYIDPPFATGANFGYQAQVHPDNGDGKPPLKLDYQPNLIEEIAYRDTWGGGLDTYLKWMYETLTFLRELLSESGSIYVHCDQTAGHYLKGVMDTVFGGSNFHNEIIWFYRRWAAAAASYQKMHDIVLFYSKADNPIFNVQYVQTSQSRSAMTRGYNTNTYVSQGVRKRQIIVENREVFDAAVERGEIDTSQYERVVYREHEGTPAFDVFEIPIINPQANERLNYPTQKPEALLERIIKASSNPEGLVLDCFVGSGTTAAVAEKLGRRWIAADMGRFAIATTRKRLLALPEVKPFQVQNLGRYERQAWQSAELEQGADYRAFILELYRAEPLPSNSWLHGIKAGRLVHIGAVEVPVAVEDVRQAVDEFRALVGSGAVAANVVGIDILGWDFGLEADTDAKELARREGINIRLRRIPREVMDSRAVDAGDVCFFELASLAIDRQADTEKHSAALTLDSFIMPQDGVPAQVREQVTHWSQWIDYWAVDWDYRNDTFNNQWQSYRTRAKPKLKLAAEHTYGEPGKRTVVVKVIDILGNDTTRRLELEV